MWKGPEAVDKIRDPTKYVSEVFSFADHINCYTWHKTATVTYTFNLFLADYKSVFMFSVTTFCFSIVTEYK